MHTGTRTTRLKKTFLPLIDTAGTFYTLQACMQSNFQGKIESSVKFPVSNFEGLHCCSLRYSKKIENTFHFVTDTTTL